MKVVNVRLLVSNFAAELAFWRDTMGFSLAYSDETMGYTYFTTDTAGVELLRSDAFAAQTGLATPPMPHGHSSVLVLEVDDVDATYAALVEQGATPLVAPTDRPAWRARTAHVGDPDGHIIEIYTPLA
jgi:catechol 2,3-dioxygenase-like lactoylglutathione lyase family enzyme